MSRTLAILAAAAVPLTAATPASEARPDLSGYERNFGPLLEDLCMDCHDSSKPKGDFQLEGAHPDLVNGPDVEKWIKVLGQLELGEMPPEKELQPTPEERAAVISWIRSELKKGGREPENKLLRPGAGNYVKHELLFGKDDFGPSFGPARVWRIRPAVYEERMRSLAKDVRYVQPFTLSNPGHAFRDYDNQYVLAGADLNQLIANANNAAKYLTRVEGTGAQVKPAKGVPDPMFALLQAGDSPSDSQLDVVVDYLFPRVMLREPEPEEIERLREFGRTSIRSDGALLGIRNLIAAVLLSPETLYRSERGTGEADAHGRVPLKPREIAFAISYALTDSKPDSDLLKAADSGGLSSRDGVRTQIARLLNDPKIDKPRILGFFREYFEYEGALDVFKDEELNRYHLPEVLVADTDRLIMHIYAQDKDVLKELLTTTESFIQYAEKDREPIRVRSKRDVHTSYSMPPDWKWTPDQPVQLREEHRAGILTQPAWLVAMSGNFDNHAIWRGLWIRKKLLGGTIPDIPIGVDAQLPEDPHRTLRDRMEVTREEYCWTCHQKMDPLGMPFEMYDHFGRFRTKELGKPVDTSGTVKKAGEEAIEGDVENAVQMLNRLAGSERVRQVFVRHVFRYFMGRNETLNDAATLREADKAYVESGGSMNALIATLLSSDSFLYRKAWQEG